MREYEVVYIFRSELEDEDVESKLDAYHDELTGDGSGEITAVEDWGKRQLAYPIENEENGRYVVAQFTVEPERLDAFERELKLDGDLLRHLVVLHEGELPTPPSARRPGAGPDEEDGEEDEEDADAGSEAGADGEDADAEDEEPGDDGEEPDEDAESDEDDADGEEPDEEDEEPGSGEDEDDEGEADEAGDGDEDEEDEDDAPEDEADEEDAEADEDDEEKE